MLINSDTKVYGIIGNPIRHSLSPQLHSEMFKAYGINAVYTAFETKDIKSAIGGIRALDIKGVNVTVPYKENVVQLVDKVDKQAQILKAINTIKNENGYLIGYNTDYLGFIYMLKRNVKEDYPSKRIAVLGAGGAAKSIIFALSKLNVNSVFLLNRTKQNSLKTKEIFKNLVNIEIFDLNDGDVISSSDIIINCTSVGLKEGEIPININYVDKAVIIDIIYKDSLLIKKARSKNLKAINGMDMFVGQALYSFELFTGIKFDMNLAYKILGDNKK